MKLWGAVAAILVAAPAAAQVQVDLNTTKANGPGYWAARSSVGWYYTPSSTFFLLAIQTRFNPAFGTNVDRTVAAELWSDRPAVGGTLLRSGAFQSNSALGTLGGGSFAPFLLQAGISYFIGFRNVQGLGRNMSNDPTSIFLGTRYGSNGPVFTDDKYELAGGDPGAPILRLIGNTSVVPEPMTMTLLATGLVGIGAASYLKRRTKS